jgi:carbonic anhydrase/acetyltransferase-like protein (isoleucine patch superfamily)
MTILKYYLYKWFSDKKYILTQDTILRYGKTLYRIKALKDFGDVKVGELGGYIETENNLSHNGNCWVSDSAQISDNAQVYGDARVYDNALVSDYARVSGNAWVSDNARISGSAQVYNNAHVSDNARISGYAQVYDKTYVSGNAHISDNARISGYAQVSGYAHLKNFDEISKTEHYFNISGFKYPITVTPTSINIGCMSCDFDMLDEEIEYKGFSQDDILTIKMMVELALNKILEKI